MTKSDPPGRPEMLIEVEIFRPPGAETQRKLEKTCNRSPPGGGNGQAATETQRKEPPMSEPFEFAPDYDKYRGMTAEEAEQEAFSRIKQLLRAIGARTKEALVEAIGKVLDMVSVQDTKGFFTHCGYRGMEQQL
jgi:hypothetical protein